MATPGPKPSVAANREAMRRNIVSAARDLYVTNGIRHTGVREIMDRVGMTRSLFYHYFKSKDEVTSVIIDEYIASCMERIRSQFRAAVTRGAEYELRTVRGFRAYYNKVDPLWTELKKPENVAVYNCLVQRGATAYARMVVDFESERADGQGDPTADAARFEAVRIVALGMLNVLGFDQSVTDETLAQALHLLVVGMR